MPGYYIWTIGCQMNKADSERLALRLDDAGLYPVESPAAASVIVLNSCVVRQAAEDRVVGKLGSLKALKRARPDLVVALTGCMVGSDREKQALARRFPWVDAFTRPTEVDPILDVVGERGLGVESQRDCLEMMIPGERPRADRADLAIDYEGDGEVIPDAVSPTRWVPIIYGCDYMCTYCIVPFRRGRERSRPLPEIVAEVERYAAEGVKEVTLLGQTIDRYGNDLPVRCDLADLFAALDPIRGLERIRFLTSHPSDMSERIVRAIAELPHVCEHVNLPFQAGDDEILQAMRRTYTAAEYRELVGLIRRYISDVSMSTDVIVGFPGESHARFLNTYRLLEELRFDVVHVAMYSPRPNTAAARILPDDVPAAEKKERLHLVEELQARVAAENNAKLLGQSVEVLVEGKTKGRWQGRTRTNKLVFFDPIQIEGHDADLVGELVPVQIHKTGPWSLQGQPSPDWLHTWRPAPRLPKPSQGAISLQLVS